MLEPFGLQIYYDLKFFDELKGKLHKFPELMKAMTILRIIQLGLHNRQQNFQEYKQHNFLVLELRAIKISSQVQLRNH